MVDIESRYDEGMFICFSLCYWKLMLHIFYTKQNRTKANGDCDGDDNNEDVWIIMIVYNNNNNIMKRGNKRYTLSEYTLHFTIIYFIKTLLLV